MTDIIVDMFSLQESSKELSKAIAKLNTVDENFQRLRSQSNISELTQIYNLLRYRDKLIQCNQYLLAVMNEFNAVESEISKIDPAKFDNATIGSVTAAVRKTASVVNVKRSHKKAHKKIGRSDLKKAFTTTLGSELFIGKTGAIQAGVKYVKSGIEKLKDNYDNKGWVYQAYQYGKATLKVGKAFTKFGGAIAAAAVPGFGYPVSICLLISAGNDLYGGLSDVVNISEGNYDAIGKNYLKELLQNNGRMMGEMFGNAEAGEKVGSIVYSGLDLVGLLYSADKMLKSFGALNTDITGEAGYSSVWGQTSFDSLTKDDPGFSLKDIIDKDFWVKKALKIQPGSTGSFIYETGKNAKSVLEKAWKFGSSLASDLL